MSNEKYVQFICIIASNQENPQNCRVLKTCIESTATSYSGFYQSKIQESTNVLNLSKRAM